MIADGDFHIPNVYCRHTVGDTLAAIPYASLRLKIDAQRLPSRAANIIAGRRLGTAKKIVITAHIDAYEDSPGASDNASDIVVLLLVAEMLSDYRGTNSIEIAALNGEDHYIAGGQMDYLRRYGDKFPAILFAINIDGAGYKRGRTSYSFYECTPLLEKRVEDIFCQHDGLVQGEHCFSGDHMIFGQKQVPSIVLTSEHATELMQTITHTSADTSDLIDCHKLVRAAEALNALVRSLGS